MTRFLLITAIGLLSQIFASAGDGERLKPYPAPRVEVKDQDGKTVKLEEIYKKGLTLVYFYPKAGTPGCTSQACSLRDAYEELTQRGVQVIGVSMDKVEAQKKFREKNRLPFTLLADPDGEVVKAFGVGSLLGFASRQAYLIKDGNVIWRDKKASTSEQAADVLRVLKEMK
jgi:peroxiredoxin Q/BCP